MKINLQKSQVFWGAVVLVLAAGAASVSYQAGYEQGREDPKTVVIRGVANVDEGKAEAVDFRLFWEAWSILKDRHIKGEGAKEQDLVYGAIKGLFASLGDPNTVFLPPVDAKKFSEDVSGEFSGIGAEIGIRNDQLLVISPLKGSPAERAGLKPKDKILKIGDAITIGLTLDEAVKRIRGPKSTTVTLNILRNNWNSPKDIEILREVIQVPTLELTMLDADGKENPQGRLAHIQLFNFYERASYEFYRTAIETILKDPQGIILDLRNNPGGFLDAGVQIAGVFLKPGQAVVHEELRGGERQTFKARGSGFLSTVPLVALINEGSASASEIVAGALRDNRGVKLIGVKSFGKGTVQEVVDLRDESLAKITIAYWLTPDGHQIEDNGLAPDVEVKITDEDTEKERDPQLTKAVEILKEAISH